MFSHKEVFCLYNKRIITVDGISEDVTLQSAFPSFNFV